MVLCALLVFTSALHPAEPLQIDRGVAGLHQTLKRLSNPYRVLHVIAHPDDEDSGTITYLSRGLGADVVIASITRGESGANLVTDDQFDRLGVLRTLEFRRAAEHYGARLRFTRFADFGYSKTLEETLKNWDREEILGDLVRVIREEQPHVILARWQGSSRDGHGHHQAAGLLAKEAFEAAGDKKRFPEAGRPWKPVKLYSDNRREDDEYTIEIDAGEYDPILGRTFAQIARDGMRAHRSQGAGSAIAGRGPAVRYYLLDDSRVHFVEEEESFFEDLGYVFVPFGIQKAVAAAAEALEKRDLTSVASELARGLAEARKRKESVERTRLERLFETGIAQALGAEVEFLVEPENPVDPRFSSFRPYETIAVATPGSSFTAVARTHRVDGDVQARVHAPAGWSIEPLPDNRYRLAAPTNVEPSTVHWSRDSVWDVAYAYEGGEWGTPVPPAPVRIEATFEVEGQPVTIRAPLEASYIDEERIQRRRPLAVGPAVSVRFATPERIWRRGSGAFPVEVLLESRSGSPLEGEIALELPPGWSASSASQEFRFDRADEQRRAHFTVTPAPDADGREPIRAVASYGGGLSAASFEKISYPGLETAWISEPAVQYVRAMEVEVAPDLTVGYVMGTGDKIPEAVEQLGAEIVMLDEAALAAGDLSRFDTILVGIRAYAVRSDLIAHNARLLDYVEQGGVLVVQYNTPEFDKNFGPYPYSMTSRPEETSEEDAPVRILAPNQPLLTTPNKITEADFEGWVEQRGSKFWVEWDERYQPLIETNDSGQEPQRGVWLAAPYGEGMYVYCALAWYRQLPYAVPGAVRIFANLISQGRRE